MPRPKHSLVTAIATLFISFALLLGWLVWERASQAEHERQKAFKERLSLHVQHIVSALQVEVRHANNLVDALARSEALKSHLALGDPIELQQWAIHKREDLSDVVGIAVFDRFGKVLGNRKAQRIGSRCVADMRAYLSGKHSLILPVHQEVRRLAHYDLTRKLQVDGETYHLLMSFHLSRLREAVAALARDDVYYELVQSQGELLFRLGENTGDEQQIVPVGDTGWRLLVRTQAPRPAHWSADWWVDVDYPLLIAFGLFGLMVWVIFSRIRADTLGLKRSIANVGAPPSEQVAVKPLYFTESTQVAQMLQAQAQQIAQLQQELEQEARIDVLTGLHNRRALEESAERWLSHARRGRMVSLTVLDLDGFKQVNDLCGHAVGDALLQALGRLLRSSVRDTDEAVRLGGDEFVVLHTDMPCQKQAQWFARLRDDFATVVGATVTHEVVLKRVDISAGSRVLAQDEADFFSALGAADGLLYKAKEQGGGRIVFDDCDLP